MMSRNVVGVLGTVIIAIYVIGSGRMVATDAEWYRSPGSLPVDCLLETT